MADLKKVAGILEEMGYLPEIRRIEKNNKSAMEAIVMSTGETFYEEVMRDMGDHQAAGYIADWMERNADASGFLKGVAGRLRDPEYVRSNVRPVLLSSEWNDLSNRPHVPVAEGIALCFHVSIEKGDGESMSAPLLNGMALSDDVEALRGAAMENESFEVRNIGDILGLKADVERALVILTNRDGFKGSAAALDPESMAKAAQMLGTEELYVLPSSIHEVIVCRNDGNSREFAGIIRSVNKQAVKPEDRLGDRPYIYKNGTLEAA